ncbi:MAG: OmpA family protein [Chitinophagaceae bacterium]
MIVSSSFRRQLLLTTCILLTLLVQAQSLLLNGDMEQPNTCTEYQVECAPEAWISSSPGFSNFFKDRNRAHSGEYCVGIDAGHSSKPFFRSFIRSRLLCGLRPGNSYRLRFFLKSFHPILDSIGYYFGEIDPLTERKPIHRLAPDGFLKKEGGFVRDSSWQEVIIDYKATGRERFFQLAYFGRNDISGPTGLEMMAVFQVFVDDISLVPLDPNESLCSGWQERSEEIYGENARHEFLRRAISYRRNDPTQPIGLPLTRVVKIDSLQMPDLFFETGKATLRTAYSNILDSLCRMQNGRQIDSVAVWGHTDNTGADTLNLRLSQHRAQAVAEYMRQCVYYTRARFRVQGWGSSRPLTPNDSPANRQRNRRVEILIYYRD